MAWCGCRQARLMDAPSWTCPEHGRIVRSFHKDTAARDRPGNWEYVQVLIARYYPDGR